MPNFTPLSDEAIYRRWARTTQDKGRQACEVQEVTFIARRPELRTGRSDGHELDRTEPVGKMHGKRRYEQNRRHWHADQRHEGTNQHGHSANELNEDRRPTQAFGRRNADGMQYANKMLGPVHDFGV